MRSKAEKVIKHFEKGKEVETEKTFHRPAGKRRGGGLFAE